MSFIDGDSRDQISLLPACVDDYVALDIAHTEKEIAYYLDRLDIIDETVAQGYEDQPLHRERQVAA